MSSCFDVVGGADFVQEFAFECLYISAVASESCQFHSY